MAWIWLSLALVVLIVELLSGTIFLLFVSVALVLPGLALLIKPDLGLAPQLLMFSIVALIGWVAYFRSRKRVRFRQDNRLNTLDVGNTVEVVSTGTRAQYRGSTWDVALEHTPGPLAPGRYVITGVRGNTLLVKPVDAATP